LFLFHPFDIPVILDTSYVDSNFISLPRNRDIMADAEEDFSSLPLPDRFTHKNWKVRKEGYEAAVKVFDLAQSENDPDVRQFINDTSLWKGAIADSNVAAQQEALGALISFLNISGIQGCTR
jgi:cytoskeleton-associated protein 5